MSVIEPPVLNQIPISDNDENDEECARTLLQINKCTDSDTNNLIIKWLKKKYIKKPRTYKKKIYLRKPHNTRSTDKGTTFKKKVKRKHGNLDCALKINKPKFKYGDKVKIKCWPNSKFRVIRIEQKKVIAWEIDENDKELCECDAPIHMVQKIN